jgi:hypothetical protein
LEVPHFFGHEIERTPVNKGRNRDFRFAISESFCCGFVMNSERLGSRYRFAASHHTTAIHVSVEVFLDAAVPHKSAEGRYNHCKTASPDYG